ncbi:MAG: SIS domain-containing protein, partial [Muribaculaceae bacterium]|nr:SIS domain-containing protein [Muribaculaceae bacterium]
LLASTFSSTGTPAINMNPCDAQHGDLGILQPNDVLLLISNSGNTKEILDVMKYARLLYPHMPVIAITGQQTSQLAKLADVTLLTAQAAEVGPYGLTPTTSVTMMTVIGHLLVDAVTSRSQFTREHYAKLHRAGNLGSQLRQTLKETVV